MVVLKDVGKTRHLYVLFTKIYNVDYKCNRAYSGFEPGASGRIDPLIYNGPP